MRVNNASTTLFITNAIKEKYIMLILNFVCSPIYHNVEKKKKNPRNVASFNLSVPSLEQFGEICRVYY